MGITNNCSKFLFYAKSQRADFTHTLTLGRLNLYSKKKDIETQAQYFGNASKSIDQVHFKDEYCEPLLEMLGAVTVDSMDYSDYEKATIVHDLNLPVPDPLKGKYTTVIDGGTIEHVFNFPVAIKNVMEMIKPGGHFIGITPANNLMGHGFYQFSPELFFRIFSPENGFQVDKLLICAQHSEREFSDWYEVTDPKLVRSRVTFLNDKPAYLMVLASKIAQAELFIQTPQQSDYSVVWANNESLKEGKPADQESKLRYMYRRFVPGPIKSILYKVKQGLFKRTRVVGGLGVIDPDHFKKVNLDQHNSN